MKYIIERPAGMPDWVEIGISVLCKEREADSNWIKCILYGYNPNNKAPYITNHGSYPIVEPFIPWTPKEGEWVRVWNKIAEPYDMVRINQYKIRNSNGRYIVGDYEWDHCARITNEDGTLIDIRCTVDELKAKTDWLGPEEN